MICSGVGRKPRPASPSTDHPDIILWLAWWVLPDSEESTFRLNGANLHGDTL